MKNTPRRRRAFVILAAGWAALAAACAPDMSQQPKYPPLGPSDFFADGSSARPGVEGTVARGLLRTDEALYTGRVDGELVVRIPVPVTRTLLERGRDRFDIYCSPCHGHLGNGEGVIAMRGFRQPTSYHIDRLREAPDGHFFDVITHGYGVMYGYAARVPADDRWAITAYIRALQRSQAATLQDVPEPEREKLTRPPQ